MNNHVPYIWRKNYCNTGPWPEKVQRGVHEKAQQYLNRAAYIINSLLEGMREFRQYRRKQIAELRPYQPGEDIGGVSISEADKEAGSPKAGDMIARNPKNRADKWLVAAQYFADNFEPV
jgi:hypothetical protein